jgi:molecular chaperone DnaK
VDSDGIVNVSARDKATGREQACRVTPSSGLGGDEIARLIEEAQRNAQADRMMKELILARGKLLGLVQSTQRSLSEMGDILPDDVKLDTRQALARADLAFRSDEVGKMAAAFEELEACGQRLTALMFGSASFPAAT